MQQLSIFNKLEKYILDEVPLIIAVHDLDHNLIWASNEYLNATGWTLSQIQGKKCYAVWHLANLCRGCPVTKAIDTGKSHEARLTPDNQDHWPDSQGAWLVKAAPLKNTENQIIGVVETAYDITDYEYSKAALKKHNAELNARIQKHVTALTEKDQLFQKAFDFSAIGMALVDPDGRLLTVNNALLRILGYSKEELLTKSFQDLTHPDDLDMDLANVKRMLAGVIDHYEMEKRYISKQGHIVWAQLNVSLVCDNVGQPLFFVAQVQDLSSRMQVLEKLAESEALYRSMVELSPNLIGIFRDEKWIFINQTGVKMLGGASPADFIGKPVTKIVHPDFLQTFREQIIQITEKSKETTLTDHKLVRLDGTVIDIQGASAPIRYGNGEIVLVVDDDIILLNLTRKILRGLGYTVLTADNAEDAIRFADKHAREIQLLITDVVMSGMNGDELAKQMQNSYPGLRCLFVSGYPANVMSDKGLLNKNLNFLQKPFLKADLAAKVFEILSAPNTNEL